MLRKRERESVSEKKIKGSARRWKEENRSVAQRFCEVLGVVRWVLVARSIARLGARGVGRGAGWAEKGEIVWDASCEASWMEEGQGATPPGPQPRTDPGRGSLVADWVAGWRAWGKVELLAWPELLPCSRASQPRNGNAKLPTKMQQHGSVANKPRGFSLTLICLQVWSWCLCEGVGYLCSMAQSVIQRSSAIIMLVEDSTEQAHRRRNSRLPACR
jgi:hypothetical protein